MEEKKKTVRVSLEGRSTRKGAYTQYHLFSMRQQKELQPHRTEKSRTGNHWENIWNLLPGRYPVSYSDISNTGKHSCGYKLLIVTESGYELVSLIQAIPVWVEAPCDCRKQVADNESKEETPVLCYVERVWAYFTTQPLNKQRGVNWDIAPYYHSSNAGFPYESEDGDWKILKVAFDAELITPALCNMSCSVEDINDDGMMIPWLTPSPVFPFPKKMLNIYAGTTLPDFEKKINEAGGKVYLPTE